LAATRKFVKEVRETGVTTPPVRGTEGGGISQILFVSPAARPVWR